MKQFQIFQIWKAELPAIEGSRVQWGYRPVIIVSNDLANAYSPVVTVIPLTSRKEKKHLRTHVHLKNDGLTTESLALCEQILTIDKSRLRRFVGVIRDPADRAAIHRAMSVQLGMAA